VGSSEIVSAMRAHPLARALRADKMCLAALEATLRAYLEGTARQDLPALSMFHALPEEVEQRARRLAAELSEVAPELDIRVSRSAARSGGGTLPVHEIPSFAVCVGGVDAEELAAALRDADPPVVGRVQDGLLWLDARTLLPEDGECVRFALKEAYERC
jgi:L-seryl-tRNA(Ser) seleniumtransferase